MKKDKKESTKPSDEKKENINNFDAVLSAVVKVPKKKELNNTPSPVTT